MAASEVTSSDQPIGRLDEMAAAVIDAAGEHPKVTGAEQVVVLIRQLDGVSADGALEFDHGMAYAGFGDGDDGAGEVIGLLLATVEALCQATGRSFRVVPVDQN